MFNELNPLNLRTANNIKEFIEEGINYNEMEFLDT